MRSEFFLLYTSCKFAILINIPVLLYHETILYSIQRFHFKIKLDRYYLGALQFISDFDFRFRPHCSRGLRFFLCPTFVPF